MKTIDPVEVVKVAVMLAQHGSRFSINNEDVELKFGEAIDLIKSAERYIEDSNIFKSRKD